VAGVHIFAQLVRAYKEYRCGRCGSAISKGTLHVVWRLRDWGYDATERFCLKCASLEVREMLKHSVKALVIYVRGGEDYYVAPVKWMPLKKGLRRVLEAYSS
jgi:hypothetical protein